MAEKILKTELSENDVVTLSVTSTLKFLQRSEDVALFNIVLATIAISPSARFARSRVPKIA